MITRRYALITLLPTLSMTACGGGSGGSSDATTPPPPPAAASVLMSLSQPSARMGDSVTLTWSSKNATACTASGAWTGTEPTSGTATLSTAQTGSNTYQLSCTGAGNSGQNSVTLSVSPAAAQVSIPGLPAPVPVASGACVPSSNTNFQFGCISSESAVPAKYDTFSSTLSSQVAMVGTAPPTVQTGGSCSAGFSSSTGQFSVNTPFGNDAIAFAGADVTEIVYTSAFLASLGIQNTITSMSALVIGDTSNTDHVQVIVYANGPNGPLTFATAGTLSTSSGTTNLNFLECLSVAAAPPPPPPPASLNCPTRRGSGVNGLSFLASQQLKFNISSTTPSQPNTTTLTWGVNYDNPNLAASAYTGSLRVELWAVPYDFQGSGVINGTSVARASPNFTGTGAKSANQIYNLINVSGIVSTAGGNNPPSGPYCMVMSLDQYNTDVTQCAASDHFCYVDWAQFPGTTSF